MRKNIYKTKILELLRKKHLLTIGEIHIALARADYSTIFRNVEQLLEDGSIKKVIIDDKSVAYESAHESHDHFICNDCGGVEELQSSIRTTLTGKVVSDVTVRGICDDCQK